MGDKVKYCSWCGEECEEKPVQVADTPILEHIEEKIDDIGRSQVWGEDSDWSKLDMDSEFEAELLVYDQMLSTATKKTVCVNCLSEDDKLYNKYYGEEDDGEIVFDADF